VRRAGTFVLNLVVAGLILAAGAAVQFLMGGFNPVVSGVAAVAALAVLLCLRVGLQWDRAVVLRLGTFHALKGPGVFGMVPFGRRVARFVDMRIRATEFFSESTLTRDTVPVDVDAVCFWLVWTPRRRCWRWRATTGRSRCPRRRPCATSSARTRCRRC